MDYEQGLNLLKQLIQGTGSYQEFLTYEARLKENLQAEKRYGSYGQIRAERAEILFELNRLALEQFDKSFNELCQNLAFPLSGTTRKEDTMFTLSVAQQLPHSTRLPQRPLAFIDYSNGDKQFLNELHTHLDSYVQAGTIAYWDTTKIPPGAQSQKEINQALQWTKVAVLLVSAEFLRTSSPLQEKIFSLSSAEEDSIRVFCVIVRPCGFEDLPLARFKAVNTRPLSSMNLAKREEIWNEVAKLVRDSL